MNTQIELARALILTPQMEAVAAAEGLPAAFIRGKVALGEIVIASHPNRPQQKVVGIGSGVRKVWAMLGDAGVRDLTCQIFEGGRHELHNETNRDEVFDYVLTWIEDHIS